MTDLALAAAFRYNVPVLRSRLLTGDAWGESSKVRKEN
jgi:hypothetical protein